MTETDRVEASIRSEGTPGSRSDVTLAEFFEPGFMREHTRFATFEEFCEESPWDVDHPDDVGERPRAELDRYVRRNTQFSSWLAMRNRAAEREIHDRLLV